MVQGRLRCLWRAAKDICFALLRLSFWVQDSEHEDAEILEFWHEDLGPKF